MFRIIGDEVLFVVELEAEVVRVFASNFVFQIRRIAWLLSFETLGGFSRLIDSRESLQALSQSLI